MSKDVEAPAGALLVCAEPNPIQLLTLGLLSGAGPQTRTQYIEIYKEILRAGEVRRG